eukprot:CAMPEP_0172057342 /NCGR_PEP_ID=MMETSP1043-20130122/6278_1 /TAXON_ID=464988 /ORGANISM="Hemiselmis andersenii, Strain CCMP441" /LENGTH=447 /DNA_ID=CAMNT_0012716831 /DNA_START=229 /DNA_END=1573 /DNA_ORIENTATION=-
MRKEAMTKKKKAALWSFQIWIMSCWNVTSQRCCNFSIWFLSLSPFITGIPFASLKPPISGNDAFVGPAPGARGPMRARAPHPGDAVGAPAHGLQQQGPAASLARPTVNLDQAALRLKGGAKAVAEAPKAWYSAFWNETVEITVLFALWYWGNIYYNIYNKKALNLVGGAKGGLVWSVATVQLLIGALWVIPLWLLGIRKSPNMTMDKWKAMAPVGLWAAGAHGGSVVALGAGAVSFGQILKACEPAFSAVTEVILTGNVQAWQVYATLIPIIGGVAFASLKELSFSWLAVIAAMIANQSAALKGVQGKAVMKEPWVKAMGAANQYGCANILSVLFCIPVVLGLEAPKWKASWDRATSKASEKDILTNTFLSGFAFYLYNEVSFMALAKVSPITHSVANTLKRVVIIVVSCVVFNTKMTTEGIVGSAIAILGTLLYSLAKQKYGAGGH